MNEQFELNKFSLRFKDEELNSLYYDSYFKDSLKVMRYASAFAVLLYIIFGIYDFGYLNTEKEYLLIIRFVIVLPYLILTFGLTYHSLFKKYGQVFFSFTIFIGGFSILIMIFSELPFSIHFVGLTLVFIFCFNFSRLLINYALFTAIALISTYAVFSVWEILINGNYANLNILMYFFLLYLALIVIVYSSSYTIEKLNKKSFSQQIIINKRNDELENMNQLLNETNQQVSSQNIELDRLNKRLNEVNYLITKQNIELDVLNKNQKKLNSEIILKNHNLESLNNELNFSNNAKDKLIKIMNKELDIASRYVVSLIPKPLSTEKIKTDWIFIPTVGLGGDAFGYCKIDRDNFAIYLLDVSGHGVGAALHSVQVLNLLHNRSLPNVDFTKPDEVLNALNKIFKMDLYCGVYFTISYAVYNIRTDILRYSGAGHPPLVLCSESGINSLESQNIFIGAVESVKYQYDEFKINKSSSLYIFSDGVFELEKPNKEMYTFNEFQKTLLEFHQKSESGLLSLYKNAQEICGREFLEDDFSLLKIRFS